ncbi:MAG: hypothetical protein QOD74_2493 [Variibacter sp.]|jgi:hypothetical protein|nr:hypothetical protein [Variibacter sp.]
MLRSVVIIAALLCAGALYAQTTTPDNENGRYTFKESADGIVRLDGRTGQVSLCNKRTAGWACQVIPDERTALDTEIARLQADNAALKRELITRGLALPSNVKPERGDAAAAKSPDVTLKLPSDAEIERMMAFMEKIWRRFVDIVQGMQKDIEKKS